MIASTPTLVTFLLYILGVVIIGWLGYRATRNFSDYILGGRRLGYVVTALAAGASDMSGWLLMGLPGAIYLAGLSGAWVALGLIIGAWCNWRFVAARLRLYTEKFGNALTLPQYFSNRFDDQSHLLRMISAFTILIFFTIYCSSGIVAGARLFESIFGIPYAAAMWIGALITICYVFVGGFLAVSWTDTLQALLMIIALILAPLLVIYSCGFTDSIETIQAVNPDFTSLISNLGWIQIISFLAWGLGYFGQPHILVRFMATKSVKNIPTSRRIAMSWMILCLTGAISVGFFGIAYFAINPGQAGGVDLNAERVFVEIAIELFNPWITGFLLAAILAAIMSTLSAQLLMCSSALTEDIYKTFLRKKASQRELIFISRSMVLLVAGIAIWLAANPDSSVLNMVSYAWAGFGAAFGPVILLSLFWPNMTRNGALAGIIIGTVTVLVWKQFAWFGLYEIIPGFVFALLGIFVVSKMSALKSHSHHQFNEAKKELEIMSS